jgi:hypothetical protein
MLHKYLRIALMRGREGMLPKVARTWALAPLSGGLLSLAFPGTVERGWLAFGALVPLLVAIEEVTWRQVGLLGLVAGLVFWLATILWVPATIENRGYLIRAANTGISAVGRHDGRIVQASELLCQQASRRPSRLARDSPSTRATGTSSPGDHGGRSSLGARPDHPREMENGPRSYARRQPQPGRGWLGRMSPVRGAANRGRSPRDRVACMG